MKHILSIIFAFVAITVSAQTITGLNDIITKTNAECPQSVTEGLTLQNVTLDDNNIIFTYEIDPKVISFDEFKSHEALMHDTKVMELQTDFGDTALAPYSIKLNLNIIYRYINGDTTLDITITPSDLK